MPTNLAVKVLSVEVEDHPLAYGSFEGTIPAGHYGAGTVKLWDEGYYTTATGEEPLKAYRAGHMHLVLVGRRFQGEWSLVRMRPADEAAKKNWLLFKLRTSRRAPKTRPAGRTRRARATDGDGDQDAPEKTTTDEETEAAGPEFVEPMKALAVTAIPEGTAWRLEIK